jgi:hypothetical protein
MVSNRNFVLLTLSKTNRYCVYTAAIEFPNYFGWAASAHYNRLKVRLRQLGLLEAYDFNVFDYVIREVIAPEIFTQMISLDLGKDHEYVVRHILYDPRAWKYGSLCKNRELWNVLGLETPVQTGRGRRMQANRR